MGANAACLISAGALLRGPAALGGGILGLGLVSAVTGAAAPGFAGGRLSGTALAILERRLGAVAGLEVLGGTAAGGLLVLGHGGVLLGSLAREQRRTRTLDQPGHPSAGAIHVMVVGAIAPTIGPWNSQKSSRVEQIPRGVPSRRYSLAAFS